MIYTTTPIIEGRPIKEYLGVVFGEVVAGVHLLKDLSACVNNCLGGRSSALEDELIKARSWAMAELRERAEDLGADAVVGICVACQGVGTKSGMLLITVSGTAVKLE